MLNVNFEAMNLEQKIDRVLTEFNFDRMSFDEAKRELLNLHSVSKSFYCQQGMGIGGKDCDTQCDYCKED
jgi:hypothetical protein